MNIDGSEFNQLTDNSTYEAYFPSWSPDGSQIAYSSSLCGYQHGCLYVMNEDGSNAQVLKYAYYDTSLVLNGIKPLWSPEGNKILFNACAYSCGGMSTIDLKTNEWIFIDWGRSPSLSPHGKYIVFSSRREDRSREDLYVRNANRNGDAQRITTTGMARKPVWGPRDDYIAYTWDGDSEEAVYLYEIKTQKILELETDLKFEGRPQWSKHGKLLMITGLTETNDKVLQFFHNTGRGMKFIKEMPHPGGDSATWWYYIKWYYDEEGDE